MCKKLVLAVGAVIVGLVVIAVSPRLSSHVSDVYNKFVVWKDTVPPEKQLEQLQKETGKIDDDIKRNLGKLASQEVEAERLERNLNGMKENQTALREQITAMSKALDSKDTKVSYNGRNVGKAVLTGQLEAKVNEYEMGKAQIKSREQVLIAKRQSLELAHERISEMRRQKDELRVTIAKLEARIENIKLKQVDCPVSMDESQVTRCNAIADKLDRQLAEEEHKADLLKTYGYGDKDAKSTLRQERSTDEVLQAAKKALQDEDDSKAVVDNSK